MELVKLEFQVSKSTHNVSKLVTGILDGVTKAFKDGVFDLKTELATIILNAVGDSVIAADGIKNIALDWDEDESKVLNAILPEVIQAVTSLIKTMKNKQ